MNDLLTIAVHNSLVVLVLSLGVYGLTRIWKNPPLAHLLWLLVLLKLLCPPLIEIEWSLPFIAQSGESAIAPDTVAINDPLGGIPSQEATQNAAANMSGVITPQAPSMTTRWLDAAVAWLEPLWYFASTCLISVWLIGAVVFASIAAMRCWRFDRELRETLPASRRLQQRCDEIADRFGIRRAVEVRYVESVVVPFLWCLGRRPTIVLPASLARSLDHDQLAMILAHELAHLRRRDHVVRGLEALVSIVYWWNPLVGLIRRQLHQAEDLCCDAWVRCSYPDCTKNYAELIFKAAESLSASQVTPRLLPASPFLRSLSLQARIEMILHHRFSPRPSWRSILLVAVIAGLVLPSFIQTSSTGAMAAEQKQPTATESVSDQEDNSATLPYRVDFEQGVTQFKEGDQITIKEVRGTAKTFQPDNIYCITGTYSLGSHDSATLAAYTTAKNAADGIGPSSQVQRMRVEKGSGKFRLFLPMSCEGWPHVSFYAGGIGIGGNYFGTGESVLRRWWGTPETKQKESDAFALAGADSSEFPHEVAFEQGATKFQTGDEITILEIRGTAPTFKTGNIYWIRGTYKLASKDRATLGAFATAIKAGDGRSRSLKVQTSKVERGEGEFTLYLPMTYEGLPHVSFYGAEDGQGMGGNYFGTGKSVLKKWWGS